MKIVVLGVIEKYLLHNQFIISGELEVKTEDNTRHALRCRMWTERPSNLTYLGLIQSGNHSIVCLSVK